MEFNNLDNAPPPVPQENILNNLSLEEQPLESTGDLYLEEAPREIIRPTDEQQKLPAMAFLKAVVEKDGFSLEDVRDFDFTITKLDKAPGKKHLQGTVQRWFTCQKDGKEKRYLIEQNIQVGVSIPDLRMIDQKTITETKMKALFAIDAHETSLQNAFRLNQHKKINTQIQALVKQVSMRVSYTREAQQKGFYGKTIRWEKTPSPTGTIAKINRAITYHGSITSAIIDNKKVTNMFPGIKWHSFHQVPCPVLETHMHHIKSVVSEINTIASYKNFDKQAFDKGLQEAPDSLTSLQKKLSEGQMSVNEILNSMGREIAGVADELILQISKDRWQHTTPEDTISLISHRNVRETFDTTTMEQVAKLQKINKELKKADEIEKISLQQEKQQIEQYLRHQLNSLDSLSNKQKRTLQDLEKMVHAMEFLTTYCAQDIKKENLQIHTENLTHLKHMIQKEKIRERVEGFKEDIDFIIEENRLKPPQMPPLPPQENADI